jgi:hypothetical protein
MIFLLRPVQEQKEQTPLWRCVTYWYFQNIFLQRNILGEQNLRVKPITLLTEKYDFKLCPCTAYTIHFHFLFSLLYLSALLTNFTHISSLGLKRNDPGDGVRMLGVLSHFRISNSDKMFTMQSLFCARPNRIPGTQNIYYTTAV